MTKAGRADQLVKECWRRFGKWPRRILIIVGVVLGLTWVWIGSLILIALADSPLHCPPTMGCTEDESKDCSPRKGLLQFATTSGSCDGSR